MLSYMIFRLHKGTGVRMSETYFRENAWWVSPFNEEPSVRAVALPKKRIELHDSTLRDGEQTPGVVFSLDDKLRIAEMLVETGITRIEAGMPAVSKSDFEAIRMISARFPQVNVLSFARATRKDIDMACECGVSSVVIEIPIGFPKLEYQFNWTWKNVLEKSADCISYAHSLGLKVLYFPYDATRARKEDIENVLRALCQTPETTPDSVGIVDTMGCVLPQTMHFLVMWYKQLTNGLPVEVHSHNDFGMAVAIELAAAAAGAEVLHCCVNGLGERTGNAALEELVLALNILLTQDNTYRLDKLQGLCTLVEGLSGIPISPNKPFCGCRNYMRESGIGADLVVKEPLAMFATDPRFFGKTGQVVLGKKSGKLSISFRLEQAGLRATEAQATEILSAVKKFGELKKRLMTDEEFVALAKGVISS